MPHLIFDTAHGVAGLAWNDAGLTAFQLPVETADVAARALARHGPVCATTDAPEWVRVLVVRAQQHLAGVMQDFSDARYDWSRVSEFQQAVYRQTLAIKSGTTRSYGDIARALALGPEGARAVGVALGSNPWPLLVPCHRVVAANGKMTGFSGPGGVRTKTRLLVLEGAELLSD